MGRRWRGTLAFILVITKRYLCLKFSNNSKEAGSKKASRKTSEGPPYRGFLIFKISGMNHDWPSTELTGSGDR